MDGGKWQSGFPRLVWEIVLAPGLCYQASHVPGHVRLLDTGTEKVILSSSKPKAHKVEADIYRKDCLLGDAGHGDSHL